MKILVVEDDAQKSALVCEKLSSFFLPDMLEQIDTAGHLSEAMKLLSTCEYALIILDLMIPFIEGSSAGVDAGLELLKQIRRADSLNNSSTLVGLSAFPDELREARKEFDRQGVLIIGYDQNMDWSNSLSRVCFDIQKKAAVKALDFVIVVALEEELNGFHWTNLEFSSKGIIGGLNVDYVSLNKEKQFRGAIIRLREMGLVASTLDCCTAILSFKPRIICMSGICAGFSNFVEFGQLVVPSPAWEYQAGKWSDKGFEISPHQIPLRPTTRVVLDQCLRDSDFLAHLEDNLPKTISRPSKQTLPIIAPAATGSAVIADSKKLEHISPQHRKISAIDMEAYGLYFAAHEAGDYVDHFFAVKSVVDLADSGKNDDFHPYGCICSARAVVHCIENLAVK